MGRGDRELAPVENRCLKLEMTLAINQAVTDNGRDLPRKPDLKNSAN